MHKREENKVKNISILGATGSIGTQTLDVIRRQKEDFNLVGISAYKSFEKVIEIIEEFKPRYAAVLEEQSCKRVREYCLKNKIDIEVFDGIKGLENLASAPETEMLVTSVVGMIGLTPTLSAIRAGKDIALANKETLVVAGEIVMKEAEQHGVSILPVDSEHGAVFQCLNGNDEKAVSRIILTASGGPFRGRTSEELTGVTAAEALSHPNWNMGRKISVDSATLMNKGLEVIEAHWLFEKSYDEIDVIVHPQSIIHSMVEYCDGSVIAQLACTDMRLPIQYALNYPKRRKAVVSRLDFAEIGRFTFEKPDKKTFRCLELAYMAGRAGGLMPTILNGANEACVELFLNNLITFQQIGSIIEECMNKFDYNRKVNVDNILELDSNVKEYVKKKYI